MDLTFEMFFSINWSKSSESFPYIFFNIFLQIIDNSFLFKSPSSNISAEMLLISTFFNSLCKWLISTSFTYTGSNTNAILYYRDRADGFTEIAGNTSGYTKEEVFEQALTRNEHFLGFIEEPRVYSDIFVDRGKQGVSEKNLRLTEIDNLGELSIYGNGFFKVRKQ